MLHQFSSACVTVLKRAGGIAVYTQGLFGLTGAYQKYFNEWRRCDVTVARAETKIRKVFVAGFCFTIGYCGFQMIVLWQLNQLESWITAISQPDVSWNSVWQTALVTGHLLSIHAFMFCLLSFTIFSHALTMGFRQVAQDMRQLLSACDETISNRACDWCIFGQQFSLLRQRHEQLCRVTRCTSSLLSPALSVIISFNVAIQCQTVYSVLHRGDFSVFTVVSCAILFLRCILCTVISFFGGWLTKESVAGRRFIYEINCNQITDDSKFQIRTFESKLSNFPAKLQMFGFLHINPALLFEIVGTIVTYSIVMIQIETENM